MFDDAVSSGAASALQRLDAALDELTTLALHSSTDAEVLALWRELEARRNRLAVVDHALIGEVQSRQLPATCGAKTVTVLARQVLRVGIAEASARVKAAEALGSRRTLTGEALAPIYAATATAQATGSVSVPAAWVITRLIDSLPDPVRCEKDLQVEAFLIEQAQLLDLDGLRQLARRLELTLDPDGTFADLAHRERHREFAMTVRSDGSSTGRFEFTAELTERLRTFFDAAARPKPETDGQKDPRSLGQRRHDALLDGMALISRADLIPDAGGVTTTVTVTMTPDAFATGTGTATTGHGVILPARHVLTWFDGDTKIIPIVLDDNQQIIAIGTGQRLFSKRQRLAMAARDGGCCFPGCDAPPQWTQAHHVIEHQDGGPTSTDNGCLLCGFHHREFEHLGWHVRMSDGIPQWTPPVWIDASQRPRTNTTHHPTLT